MSERGECPYEGVDFFSDGSLIEDPYPYFDFLRKEKGPVWIEPQYGVAIVTGHPEAMTVLRDPDTFSSCNAPTGPFPGFPVAPEGDDATAVIEEYREQLPMHEFMVTMDPPQHSEYRGLMRGLFTPRRLQENEGFMWHLADQLLDEFLCKGQCEFVVDYAIPFTSLVITDILGVPEADRTQFRKLFAKLDIAELSEDQHILADNPLAYIEDAFKGYVEDRRETPRQDVLTHLALARFSDDSVPDVAALAREASFVFAAGQETTVRLLAFAMRHLAEHADVQERLRSQRELIPEFIEEILRLESPIKAYFRMARRTIGTLDSSGKPASLPSRGATSGNIWHLAAGRTVALVSLSLDLKRVSPSSACWTACRTSKSSMPSTARRARASGSTCRHGSSGHLWRYTSASTCPLMSESDGSAPIG
jgi:cytochrome P450